MSVLNQAQLETQANTIKNETGVKLNTATRYGTLFIDLIQTLFSALTDKLDKPVGAGTTGQILTRTSTGWQWQDPGAQVNFYWLKIVIPAGRNAANFVASSANAGRMRTISVQNVSFLTVTAVQSSSTLYSADPRTGGIDITLVAGTQYQFTISLTDPTLAGDVTVQS